MGHEKPLEARKRDGLSIFWAKNGVSVISHCYFLEPQKEIVCAKKRQKALFLSDPGHGKKIFFHWKQTTYGKKTTQKFFCLAIRFESKGGSLPEKPFENGTSGARPDFFLSLEEKKPPLIVFSQKQNRLREQQASRKILRAAGASG